MFSVFQICLLVFSCLLLSPSSFANPIDQGLWNCEKAEWSQEPELTEGIFTATISGTCWVNIQKESGIQWLFQRLQKEYQRSEKYEIHQGPSISKDGSFTVINYDLTDKLNEEDSDLAIRQDVQLRTDEKKELIYLTNSKVIQASGTAAYLRSVSFETQVRALSNAYRVTLQNRVEIEKPWFALGFLFKPMSASITQDKFLKAQEKLIQYLTSSL
ncbi:MAG: hypothetical protein EBQ92_08190 [Proteobacteria bacterium]|nr:hypothetical protein [Pseudomonadota bacterium]